MATISELREIASRYSHQTPESERMMQHTAHSKAANTDSYERKGNMRPRSVGTARKNAGNNAQVAAVNKSLGEAAAKQTEIMQSQTDAVKKQSQSIERQTGLMQDQIKATENVSEVIKKLSQQMDRQSKKLHPKIQEFARPDATGKFFHGNRNAANDAINRRRSITEELRQRRRERARLQERDERGRFRRNRINPRIQNLGGGAPGGAGAGGAGALGRLGGMVMRGAGPLAMLAAMFFGSRAIQAAQDNYEYDKHKAGTIAKGWQSAKDYAGDINGIAASEGSLVSLKNKMSESQISGAANRASGGPLGSVAEHFESGGRGVGTVSTGKGDNGGVSYGKHQLSSKSGMNSFLRSEEGSKFYNDFRGLAPGTKEFDEKYKQVAKDRGTELEVAQSGYIKRTHYDPVSGWFSKQFGIDPEKRSKAFREMLYSIGVQYGFDGARSLISEALGNRDVSAMSDRELINRIQNFRQSSVTEKFRSSSAEQRLNIADRAGNEKSVLLDMLDRETTGKNNTNMGGQGQSVLKEQLGRPGVGGSQMQAAADSFKPQAAGGAGSDEAGGGTMAGKDFQANGNFYNIGMKNTIPKDNTVNMAGLNEKFKKAWYTMVGDWVTNCKGGKVTVASAFRTRAEQEELWVKYGRNTKRVARPGTSRHEKGFAIDIDRASAQSLESTGMFKKYGFHRPLSNEPWHVELIGAGKGGAPKGGTPEQPALMQQAAAKEMTKAADETIATAEENTKTDMKTQGASAQIMSDSETQPSSTAEAGAQKAAGDAVGAANEANAKTGGGGGGTGGDGGSGVTTTPQQNLQSVMDLKDKNRSPESQALYEQYLRGANGDPRKVPDTVTNGFSQRAENVGPKPANAGDPYRVQTTAAGTGIPAQTFGIKQGDLAGSALDKFGKSGAALDSYGKPGTALDGYGKQGDALNDLTKAANDPNKRRKDSDVLNEISIDENGVLTHVDPTGKAPMAISTPGFNPTAQNPVTPSPTPQNPNRAANPTATPGTGNGITAVPKGTGGAGVGLSSNPQAAAGTMDAFGRLFDVRAPTGYSPYGSSSNGGGNADIAKGVRMARSVDPRATGTVTGGVDKALGVAGAGYSIAHASNKMDAVLRSGALPGLTRDAGLLQSAKSQFDYNPIAAIQTLGQSNIVQGIRGGLSSLMGPKGEDAPTNSPTMTTGKIQSTEELFKPSVAPSSPAAPAFYSSDTPVISRPSTPTQTMAAPTPAVSSFTAAPPVDRQVFDNVQTVRVADQPMQTQTSGAAPSGGGGGSGKANGNSQMDVVQLDEVPAIIDDFGLLFITAGFS